MTLTLARPSEVEAAVYDVLGRRVATVASERFPAGTREVAFDGAGLAAGVYVVRARTGDGHVEARRVSVVR